MAERKIRRSYQIITLIFLIFLLIQIFLIEAQLENNIFNEASLEETVEPPFKSTSSNKIIKTSRDNDKPDLTVTDIIFNPTTPTRENEFTIAAIIKNLGPSNVSDFKVGFFKDTLDYKLGESDSVTGILTADEVTSVIFSISKQKAIQEFNEAGEYMIYVMADPNNLTSETEEGNNVLFETLTIKLKADLSIIDNEIKFEELEVENGVETNIRALIRNVGETNSDWFTVRFFDGDPKNERQIDIDRDLTSLAVGGLAEVKVTWSSTEGGWHDIWVKIDTATDEESIRNNSAFNSIYVKIKPDLSVTEIDIIIISKENAEIIVGEVIEIQVTIHNIGDTTAKNFDVNLWDGTPNAPESISIANSDVINLDGHADIILESGSYAFTTVGNHPIYVDIDPDNRIPEKDETNNIISKNYWINESAPDLLISNWVLKSTLRDDNYNIFVDGEQFWFEFQFRNDGTELAKNITVTLYQDDMIEIDNIIIDELTETDLENECIWRTRDITATYLQNFPDFHKIIVKVDPMNEIRELNEDNNLLEIPQGYKVTKTENDTDDDNFLNAWEEYLGTDPLDPNDKPLDTDDDGMPDGDKTNSKEWMDTDDDNDAMPDSWEFNYSLNPKNASDAVADPDGDGFSNLNEYLADTDPLDYDDRPEFFEEPTDRTEDWGGFLVFIILIVIIVMIITSIIGKIILDKRKRDEEFYIQTFGHGGRPGPKGDYQAWVRTIEKGQDGKIRPRQKYKLEVIGGTPETFEKDHARISSSKQIRGSKKVPKRDPRFKGKLCLWCDRGITRKYIKRCPGRLTADRRCSDGPFCSEKCLDEHLSTVPHYKKVDF